MVVVGANRRGHVDAKGSKALVERLAREGRYSSPTGASVEEVVDSAVLVPEPAEPDDAAPGPAERAA